MQESNILSVIDSSVYLISENTIQKTLDDDGTMDLKLLFIKHLEENGPCIGVLQTTSDLIPSGGGKVW